ncbi:hypothetical protein ABT147_33840 [Streptomyces sp. NPDC001868]
MSPHLDAVRVERVWVAGGVVRIAAGHALGGWQGVCFAPMRL